MDKRDSSNGVTKEKVESSVCPTPEMTKSEAKKSVRLTPAEYFLRSRQRHMKLVDICQSNDGGKVELSDLRLSLSDVDNLVEKFKEKVKIEADREAAKKDEAKLCEVPKEKDKLPERNEKTGILLPRGPISVRMGRSVAPSPYSFPEGMRSSKDRYTDQFYPTECVSQNNQYRYYCSPKFSNSNYVNSQPCLDEADLHENSYASYLYSLNSNCFAEPIPYLVRPDGKQYMGNFEDGQYLQQDLIQQKKMIPQQMIDWTALAVDRAEWQQQLLKTDDQHSPLSDSTPSSNHSICTTAENLLDFRQTKPPPLDSPNSEQANSDRENELPDGLCDFILKYSRKYQSQSLGVGKESFPPQVVNECKAFAEHSSPLSAKSFGDSSPAAPVNTQTANVCTSVVSSADEQKVEQSPIGHHQRDQHDPKSKTSAGDKLACSKDSASTNARQLLRESIDGKSLENAWAWAIKCELTQPGLLYETDHDGDSMLHIAVWQKNRAYIYALTEVMLKTRSKSRPKPFDLLNKWNESPFYFAVVKKLTDIVRYFMEYGAKANVKSKNMGNDSLLHYAASNGLTAIAEILCSNSDIDLNIRNDSGMTPLHLAVKNHGVADEQTQAAPNNISVVKFLLNSNADPFCQVGNGQLSLQIIQTALKDSKGKTVIHYCVEKMDVDLLELIFENLNKEVIRKLLSTKTLDGLSPLEQLESTIFRQFSHLSKFGNEQLVKEKLLHMLSQSEATKSS
ncbi:Ank 2 domain containing protein [Trichuris trichiura]|uniref:Ank 2 domain containing protein n=1 Tax=Trichuris trichiura TaxID=36087 RepID=A0A077Z7Z1_TRITR|nr:Ank 2 domain containing protein [Trichuris trichiura]